MWTQYYTSMFNAWLYKGNRVKTVLSQKYCIYHHGEGERELGQQVRRQENIKKERWQSVRRKGSGCLLFYTNLQNQINGVLKRQARVPSLIFLYVLSQLLLPWGQTLRLLIYHQAYIFVTRWYSYKSFPMCTFASHLCCSFSFPGDL